MLRPALHTRMAESIFGAHGRSELLRLPLAGDAVLQPHRIPSLPVQRTKVDAALRPAGHGFHVAANAIRCAVIVAELPQIDACARIVLGPIDACDERGASGRGGRGGGSGAAVGRSKAACRRGEQSHVDLGRCVVSVVAAIAGRKVIGKSTLVIQR